METILINRLQLVANTIKRNTELALKYSGIEEIDLSARKAAELVRVNLETSIKRFNSELHEYFRTSRNPSPDVISQLSELQLTGEEVLNELVLKLKPQQCTSTHNNDTVLTAKLPRLELPQFNGDPLEWPSFWDTFVSNIDSKNLSEVDKLMYLKSSLQGVAKEAIDGLEMRNLNYQIAVRNLKERFGKDMLIIDAHYSALYKVKAAEANPQDCRRTLNEIEKHLRILQSLKEDVNHNNLRFLLIEKFPEDIIYEVRSKGTNYTIDEMRKSLEQIISAKEEANSIKERKNKEERKSVKYTTETLHTRINERETYVDRQGGEQFKQPARDNRYSTKRQRELNIYQGDKAREQYGKRRKITCIFCGDSHYNDQCAKVTKLEERRKILKDRCFCCFRLGHRASSCERSMRCPYCQERNRHNRALCPKRTSTRQTPIEEKKHKEEMKPTNTMHINFPATKTILQTAIVNLSNDKSKLMSTRWRALLDSGSERTYISQRVMKELNLHAEENNLLSVFTFGTNKPQEYDSPLVKINIILKNGDVKTIFANVVPTITNTIPYQEIKEIDKNELADDGSLGDQIDVLIGNDYYFTFMTTEKHQINENLFLVHTEFGWMLSGKIHTPTVDELSCITYVQSCSENKFNLPDLPIDNTNLKSLFDLETIGIVDSPTMTKDEQAILNFKETTEIINNRYTVCWPWNEYPPELHTNFGLAYGRLTNLLKRLDKETLRAYDQTLKEQLKKGIIEIIPEDYNEIKDHPVHYLPHHCVQQSGKALRIVYDASAKIKGNKSLNECLHRGPMMLEDLTGLILRFRTHRIGIIADVEKAFLQIALQERDKDVTRFLWLHDLEKGPAKDNIQCFRFCRVPFGIISSPFLLNATIRHHLMSANAEILRRISYDIYVDNMVTGTETLEQARTLYEETKKSFQEISMNLREWGSNSKEFLTNIQDRVEGDIIKVLGLEWKVTTDTLKIRNKEITPENTMRGVLKVTASIFDPCGLVAPILLPAKLLIQHLWEQKRKWDEILPKEIIDQWNQITSEFQYIKEIEIPRTYENTLSSQKKQYELHCFSDASTQAYAAVVYLRTYKEGNDDSTISFVMGKSRVAPLNTMVDLRIPKLELLGALIGSKLLKYTENHLHLKIQNRYLWTDSEIVLSWLNTEKTLQPFICRRVKDIKQIDNLITRYVPSEHNPADKGTRPTNTKDNNKNWIKGPNFLTMNPTHWPSQKTIPEVTNIKSLAVISGAGEGLIEREDDTMNDENDDLVERVDATLKDENDTIEKDQTAQIENRMTEIKRLQEDHFPEECKGKETNLSRNLKLFKDRDGILRSEGRMQYADWTYDKRYPILIPRNSEFTRKLIKEIHEKNKHVGVNHTLSAIREYYWIPQGKEQVKKVIKLCPRCIKHGGGPFKLPPTPALPPERVNYSAPFTFTGVDHLGPIQVDTENGLQKRWICLYTCLAVRAIHLEVVKDLSSDEGLLALRRMVATRGIPQLITSDNATNFQLMSDILSKPYCIENKIKWKFIPQLAPWFGGFYERLVALVKHCMKRSLSKHLINDSQLLTIVKEIEAVLNTRPLTTVDSEMEHILKPSDFLTMGRCITVTESSDGPEIQGTITKKELIKGWKRTIKIVEEFKSMFVNKYLLSLRERYGNTPKEPRIKSQQIPHINQIVQIKEDKNRESWKVGRIIYLRKDNDGHCRVAKVKVGNSEYIRSISQLYPLEIEEEDEVKIPSETINKKPQIQESHATESDVIHLYPLEIEEELETKIPSETTSKKLQTQETHTSESDVIQSCENAYDLDEDTEQTERELEQIPMDTDSPESERPKRHAASRALEKIREWTRNLTTLL